MLEAPSVQKVIEHIILEENKLCCILFAPPFDNISTTQIIPRLGYLDHRTSKNIHFYLVGYYGYGTEDFYYPDGKSLGQTKYKDETEIPWYFSQTKFAEFIDEMEQHTSWKYSGGTELIILNEKADFENAIIFKIDSMLKDGALENVSQLFEGLIQHSRINRRTVEKFSIDGIGKQTAEAFVDALIELLPKGVKSLTKIWTKGKHYTLENIK
jgi:hypothetical protein